MLIMIDNEINKHAKTRKNIIRATDTPMGVKDIFLRQLTNREQIVEKDFDL